MEGNAARSLRRVHAGSVSTSSEASAAVCLVRCLRSTHEATRHPPHLSAGAQRWAQGGSLRTRAGGVWRTADARRVSPPQDEQNVPNTRTLEKSFPRKGGRPQSAGVARTPGCSTIDAPYGTDLNAVALPPPPPARALRPGVDSTTAPWLNPANQYDQAKSHSGKRIAVRAQPTLPARAAAAATGTRGAAWGCALWPQRTRPSGVRGVCGKKRGRRSRCALGARGGGGTLREH